MSASPTPEAVLPLLTGRLGRPYTFLAVCASTQRLLGADAADGETVVADHQTEGRGRLGRSWEAPPGTSVLMSVCVRPRVDAARLPGLTVVAAGAVAEAIAAETGVAPALKHPNDVLVEGRKVASSSGSGSTSTRRSSRRRLGFRRPRCDSRPAGSTTAPASSPRS